MALGLPIGGWVIPPTGGAPKLVGGGNPGWCIGVMEGIVGGPGGRLVGAAICFAVGVDCGGPVGGPLYCPCGIFELGWEGHSGVCWWDDKG